MEASSLKYHKNRAHLMPLESQACFVPRAAHMRTTTALRSSHEKVSEGWVKMHMFIANIADFVNVLWD